MEWAILTTVTILYSCQFILGISSLYKQRRPSSPIGPFVRPSRQNIAIGVFARENIRRQFRRKTDACEKVNWKEEGF